MSALKPTRFLSSSEAILKQLGLRCRGTHRHQQLLGSGRASAAAIYPPGLCKAILVGAQEQLQRDRGAVPAPAGAKVRPGVRLAVPGRSGGPKALHCRKARLRPAGRRRHPVVLVVGPHPEQQPGGGAAARHRAQQR